MKIFVKAKPNAKKESVEKVDENRFIVSVKEPPVRGEANKAIIVVLAAHFNISPSRISIVSGHTSREKVIEIT